MRSTVNVPVLLMVSLILAAVGSLFSPSNALAQRGDQEKAKLRVVDLRAKDGVGLKAFYFPSDKGKEAIPVLVVHEWGGQASPYAPLVAALHQAGCAVMVPDYRGHGKSDRKAYDARGRERELVPTQMNRGDVESIVNFDLEACKAFLKEENNEEKLNLNALVLVGVREGAVLTTKWAARDWSFPSVGRIKQGQDVKAMVYVSPDRLIKGVSLDSMFRDRALMSLPIMIVAGAASPQADEAERMFKRIEVTKRKRGRGKVTGLTRELPSTPLSGPTLVQSVRTVIPAIVKFINEEVIVTREMNPWVYRE